MSLHQAKRLQSPCVIITNHDAAIMPTLMVPHPAPIAPGQMTQLKFDRILADVPCTGAGGRRDSKLLTVVHVNEQLG